MLDWRTMPSNWSDFAHPAHSVPSMKDFRSDVILEMNEPLDALCTNKNRSMVVVGGRNGEMSHVWPI